MKVVQAFRKSGNWEYTKPKIQLKDPLVLVFAERNLLQNEEIIQEIKKEFPYTNLIFGSTAGEILGNQVLDNAITVTAIEFEKSSYLIKRANILEAEKNSYQLGKKLMEQFPQENLKHLFIISEGSFVNGSALIHGIEQNKTKNIKLTGGLCGDNERFEKTLVSFQDNPKEGEVIAIGFYGESLEISFSSCGGWLPFGPERIITKSKDNILYEIGRSSTRFIF